ncbi:MAG: HigA family addiction module antitoxin [Bdellovibrionales bacterium]
MPMKNPAHPGTLIKDDLDALGYSVAQAAKALGVTRQQLHRVVSGRCAVTPDMALRLEAALGGSDAGFWLRMQASYDLAQARKGRISVSRLEPQKEDCARVNA